MENGPRKSAEDRVFEDRRGERLFYSLLLCLVANVLSRGLPNEDTFIATSLQAVMNITELAIILNLIWRVSEILVDPTPKDIK